MALTFDATLKDMSRKSPQGFLATFDQPPALPLRLLNVDLSTVTAAADLVVGLGDPLAEIVQIDFQSSAAAWKHADLLAYHALLFAHYHVPVHTIIVLLRPQAAHANLDGAIGYAPRPGRGSMNFGYQIVRLWERSAEELLRADLGVAPLAVLGRLPEGQPLEEGLSAVARRLAERSQAEAPERVAKLLLDAYLLTGLRVKHKKVADRIFGGVRAMHESTTYQGIIDEGQEKFARRAILALGKDRCGTPEEAVKDQLTAVTDLDRLERMLRQAAKATNWQEILDTP